VSRLSSQPILLGIAYIQQITICFPLMVNREKLQHCSLRTAQASAAWGAGSDLTMTIWLQYRGLSSWQTFWMNCCIKVLAILGEVDGAVRFLFHVVFPHRAQMLTVNKLMWEQHWRLNPETCSSCWSRTWWCCQAQLSQLQHSRRTLEQHRARAAAARQRYRCLFPHPSELCCLGSAPCWKGCW